MLNFGNKEFRNLQEQVLKNMADIKDIHEGATVLADFGIKVVGQVDSSSDLPDPTEYEGEYGDAYVVGEEAPYDYYIFTRPFEDNENPQWFNLGQFPAPGPQGETGETGATGATPAITASASTSTLSAGQNASVSITKTGSNENPHFTFAFSIPQGAQGIQGVQGAQGIQGPAGPQGIQGQKGDTGYLYTIIGQVNSESSLPLPGQLPRTSAFLVGSQEPFDVYIIIGQDVYDLEWLNIGPIATVVPTTYIASDTDASSGTLDSTTLAAINNETNAHYLRVGSYLYEFSNKYNGNGYYMSLRYDGSTSSNNIDRLVVALSSGAWTTGSDRIPDTEHTVFTNTNQTITGSKTFSSTIHVGPDFQIGVNGTAPSEYYSLLRTGAYSEGIFFNTGGIGVSAATVYPLTNNAYDIGSSSSKWKDLWLSGYLRDGTNSISLSNIVTTGSEQTITANKTITGIISGNGTLTLQNAGYTSYSDFDNRLVIDTDGFMLFGSPTLVNETNTSYLNLYDNEIELTAENGAISISADGDITLSAPGGEIHLNTIGIYNGSIIPDTNNNKNLGSSSYKFNNVYTDSISNCTGIYNGSGNISIIAGEAIPAGASVTITGTKTGGDEVGVITAGNNGITINGDFADTGSGSVSIKSNESAPNSAIYLNSSSGCGISATNVDDEVIGQIRVSPSGVTINGDVDETGNGFIYMLNLPTSDPQVAGALWNDNGTLKISSGS